MRRFAPLMIAALLTGCSLFSPKKAMTNQLENVAKDWCLTMRASQVLCVYPLSEDVQVGDIYLVNTSIPNQVKQYVQNGFLPFDMLLTRLQPVNYRAMYANAYATQDQWANIPHQWQSPPNATANNWTAAPHAAFPSYTFAVQQGQSLKLAVPVQAVPIGLSLLNSNQAHGAIEISDASTYGVDQLSLDQQVEAWAACPTTRALLTRYAPNGPMNEHYIRVITRVYLTGTHRYPGDGFMRTLYLGILLTHTVLAVVTVPLVLRSLFLARGGRYPEHRKIARYSLPVWLYVSVTGVVVYLMLYQL